MPNSNRARLEGQIGDAAPQDRGAPGSTDSAPLDPALVLLPESASSQASLPLLLEDQPTVISKKPLSNSAPIAHPVTPAEMGKTLVGHRLGHFELEEFVGGGGMGAVFRATDTMLGRTVAVKVLSRDQTDDETIRRFKNEALNAARLDHERIARVYYVSEDQGWHYIVFEYIDGLNIRDLVQERGPLALDEGVYYTLQVAEALRHAYRREVVHRDIKPSNIVVLADGRVKLVDMGLARHHQVDPDDDLTASGVTLGTFDYISPEQARDPRNADVRSDLYSLGCTLYFMLTGRPPFADGTVLQKLLSHSTDVPPDPRLYRPDVPDDICRVLAKMLAKIPAERYATPDDLIVELLEVADRLGLENSAKSAKWVSRPVPQRTWYEQHLPWLGPVVALVLIVVALDWILVPPRDGFARPNPNLPTLAQAASPPRVEPEATSTDKKSASKRGGPRSNNPPTPQDTDASKKNDSGKTSPNAGRTGENSAEVPDPFVDPNEIESPDESTIGDGDTQAEVGPAVMVPVDTIIVSTDVVLHGPSEIVVRSLKKAIEEAAKLPSLETIELAFDERVEEPLEIDARAITIRAAAGRTPVIVFRPDADSLADVKRMIRIRGGQANAGTVKFEGVQFRLELPKDPTGEGWSLFSLEQQAQLRMDRCAMTIKNASAVTNGVRLQEDVAFFAVASPTTDTLRPAAPPPARRPLIDLEGVVARGEATFVSSQGVPFVLNWTQGLLATSGRMIEVGGADSQPRVNLNLTNVTIDAHEGLCLLNVSEDGPKPVRLEVEAHDSIFLTQSSAALIEQHTLDSVSGLQASKSSQPKFVSVRNIVNGPLEFWRIVSKHLTEQEPTAAVPLNEKAQGFGLTVGEYLDTEVWWELPAPLRSPHARTKSDYLLAEDPTNPALHAGSDPGFDPDSSPDFVREATAGAPSPPPSSGTGAATPMGTTEKVRSGMPTLPEKMMMPIVPMEKMKPSEEQP